MIKCILSSLGLALLAIVGTVIHYEGISLPIVGQLFDGEIAGRLEGYVALSEKTAAEAKIIEISRQAEASKASTEQFRKRAQEAETAEAIAQAELEKGIAAYEKRLVDIRRACLLDDDDIGEILQHR